MSVKVEVKGKTVEYKRGVLFKHQVSDMVICCTGNTDQTKFEGFVINMDMDKPIGFYGTNWLKSSFTLFSGTITLTQ